MTQLNLEKLLKTDNESYNLLRVISMFMKLDDSQNVPLQAMAVFWYVATYQNCSKKDIELPPPRRLPWNSGTLLKYTQKREKLLKRAKLLRQVGPIFSKQYILI